MDGGPQFSHDTTLPTRTTSRPPSSTRLLGPTLLCLCAASPMFLLKHLLNLLLKCLGSWGPPLPSCHLILRGHQSPEICVLIVPRSPCTSYPRLPFPAPVLYFLFPTPVVLSWSPPALQGTLGNVRRCFWSSQLCLGVLLSSSGYCQTSYSA